MVGFRDAKDMLTFATDLTEDRDQPVRVVALVEEDAPVLLVDVLKEALRPRTTTAMVDVGVIEDRSPGLGETPPDVVILAVGSAGAGAGAVVAEARDRAVPIVALVAAQEMGDVDLRLGQPTSDVVVGADGSALLEGLAIWMADRMSHKRLALAANFPFTRRAIAEESVKTTAWQNALVGTVTIIPGADMPIMTANQAKMILRIAAAYGERISVDRVKELAVVVGGGFTLRAVARQGLTLLPGFGWAVKGGVAYSGTVAMGKAAIKYFEEGMDLGGVARLLQERGAEIWERARTRGAALPADAVVQRRTLPLDEPPAAV